MDLQPLTCPLWAFLDTLLPLYPHETPLPSDIVKRILREIKHHPLIQHTRFRTLETNQRTSLLAECGKRKLEAALPHLYTCLQTDLDPQTLGDDYHSARQCHRTVIHALVRYGPREQTNGAFYELAETGHPNRDLLMRALLLWRAPLPTLSIRELFSLAFSPGTKWSQKRAKEKLYQLFSLENPEHAQALHEHARTQYENKPFYRYYSHPSNAPDDLLRPGILRFLGLSAPQSIRSALLNENQGKEQLETTRDTLRVYLEHLSPGYLAAGSYAHFGYGYVFKHLREGAREREWLALRDHTANPEQHIQNLTVPRQRILQAHGAQYLLGMKANALPALAEWMQQQEPYQPGPHPRGFGAHFEPAHFIYQEEKAQRRVGRVFGRILFGNQRSEEERMAALRNLLTLPANDGTWTALITYLDHWCRHEAFQADVVYHYVNTHIENWSHDIREAPRRWFEWYPQPTPRPRPWPVIRRIDVGWSAPLQVRSFNKNKNIDSQKRHLAMLLHQSEPITQCTQLCLHFCLLNDELLKMLFAMPQISPLRFLSLDRNNVEKTIFREIAESDYLHDLTHLSFSYNPEAPNREWAQKAKPKLKHIATGKTTPFVPTWF
jgi:hypothetical protein